MITEIGDKIYVKGSARIHVHKKDRTKIIRNRSYSIKKIKEIEIENNTFNFKNRKSFILSSCYGGTNKDGFKLNRQDFKFKIADYHFILGDVLYSDRHLKDKPTWDPEMEDDKGTYPCSNYDDYMKLYREEVFSTKIGKILNQMPTTVMMDDHEIVNNFSDQLHDGKVPKKVVKAGIKAFEANFITPKKRYYKFDFNEYLDIFILNIREERLNLGEKRIISDKQFKWIVKSLNNSKKKFKLLITSIPFMQKKAENTSRDRWSYYTKEHKDVIPQTDKLLAKIKDVKGLFIAAGDYHYGTVHHVEGIPEIVSSSVASRTKQLEIKDEIFGTIENHYVEVIAEKEIIVNYYNSLSGDLIKTLKLFEDKS